MFDRLTRVSAMLVLVLTCIFTAAGNAEDVIEKAGVGVGLTVGNMLFLPIKAIAVSMGALSGALSFVVTGGNADLTKQIWQDTTEGPYAITPDVARMAVGQRPELAEKK
jgi:hypothetical protein